MISNVEQLWRFPVKSMAGESITEAEITAAGVVGDRGYALIDTETGKVVSAKHPARWRGILDCRAAYVETPRRGAPLPPVTIDLPDGTSTRSDVPEVDKTLSEFFDREVTLALPAATEYLIDEYVPDTPDVRPEGYRDELTQTPIGAGMFRQHGLPAMVPEDSFFDLMPLSVLSTASLARLAELAPESRVDQRRFRMNVIVSDTDTGFVENDWLGHTLAIGDSAGLLIMLPTPRCVMTNLAQGDLPKDANILKTTTVHNRVDVVDAGKYPCLGAYAIVAAPGTVRVGDPVLLR